MCFDRRGRESDRKRSGGTGKERERGRQRWKIWKRDEEMSRVDFREDVIHDILRIALVFTASSL